MPHHWPFKSHGLFNSELFLKNFHCNIFWYTNTKELVRPIFQSLFEDTTVTTNLLKSYICSTSCIEIHTFFAISNNKELRNFKVRPAHRMLKRIDDGLWKVFSDINTMNLVTQNYLFRKSDSSDPAGMACLWEISIIPPLRETSQRPLRNISKKMTFLRRL